MESSAERVSVSKTATKTKQNFAARFFNKIKDLTNWDGKKEYGFRKEDWLTRVVDKPFKKVDVSNPEKRLVDDGEDHFRENIVNYIIGQLGSKARGEGVHLIKDNIVVSFLRENRVPLGEIERMSDDDAWKKAGEIIESEAKELKIKDQANWVKELIKKEDIVGGIPFKENVMVVEFLTSNGYPEKFIKEGTNAQIRGKVQEILEKMDGKKSGQVSTDKGAREVEVGPGKLKILMVEDDPGNLELYEAAFDGNQNYKFSFARNVTEALEILNREKNAGKRFDLVVSDLMMSGDMDAGLKLAETARADELTQQFVLYTALASAYKFDKMSEEQLREKGLDRVINKPVTTRELEDYFETVKKKLQPQDAAAGN